MRGIMRANMKGIRRLVGMTPDERDECGVGIRGIIGMRGLRGLIIDDRNERNKKDERIRVMRGMRRMECTYVRTERN